MNRILFILLILLPSLLFTQEGNNIIFWGKNGLSFKTEPPTFFNTAGNPWVISSAFSDKKGELMFYINEDKFYNKYHEIIEGSDSIICGASMSVKSSSFLINDLQDSNNIILFSVWKKEKRELTNQYYSLNEKDSGLYVSIINTKMNNGRGKLITQNKLIYKGFLDQLTIVRHGNGKDYWIICKSDTNTFKAFLYDHNGIHPPIESHIPKIYKQITRNCRMKANNKGDLLALTNYYWEEDTTRNLSYFFNYFHLLNFNQINGKIAFARIVDEFYQITPLSRSGPDSIPYGIASCSFSPNDSILYINSTIEKYKLPVKTPLLYQYQIYSSNVPGSRKIINSSSFVSTQLEMMQLAPNGKIYVGCFHSPFLACIEKPNLIGDACSFNMKYLPLPNNTSSNSLSNIFYEYKKVSFTTQKENCRTLKFTKDSDTSFVSYTWYFGDGDSAVGATAVHTYTSKGKFMVKLKATTAYGYSVWNSQEVFTTDIPIINFTTANSVGCQYIAMKFNDLTLSDTLAGTISYRWDFGDGTSKTITTNSASYKPGIGSVSHVYNKSGSYTITLTFNNGFCKSSISKTNAVNILPAPKPGITASVIHGCAPIAIKFTDTLTSNIISKEYDFGNGVFISCTANRSLDTTIIYTKAGNYFIHQKLTGITGCVTEDTITIKLLPGIDQTTKPEIYFASYINDSIIEVTWKPVPNATNYHLKVNSKIMVLNSTVNSFQLKDLIGKKSNTFQIMALDTCGNRSPISEITRTVYLSAATIDEEYISIRWTPYEFWKDGVLKYDLERKMGNSFDWQKIYTSNSLFQHYDELKQFDTLTTCEICYRITAFENGNNYLESKSNKVCTYLKPTVFIPNAFSPNDDGLNDLFKPFGTGIDYYEMYIYNRWGEVIFEGQSEGTGWDGKLIDGSLAAEGVYLYTIQSINKSEKKIQKVFNLKGTIMLNR